MYRNDAIVAADTVEFFLKKDEKFFTIFEIRRKVAEFASKLFEKEDIRSKNRFFGIMKKVISGLEKKEREVVFGWNNIRVAVLCLIMESQKTLGEIQQRIIKHWPFLLNSKGQFLVNLEYVIYKVIDNLCENDLISPSGNEYKYIDWFICPRCGKYY